jgi:hypothetical protein
MMRWRDAAFGLVVLAAALPGYAQAPVMEEHFHVRTTADFVAICSADPHDPLVTAAVNFCQGFTVGVYQTLEEEDAAVTTKLFCISNPLPTRNQAIAAFVQWAKASPTVLSERAPDAILRYLEERYPCGKR